MKPFFFIPASKLKNISKIKNIGVKDIIIDFEDSITMEQKIYLKDEIVGINNFENYWFRVPLREGFDDDINPDYMLDFINKGVRKLVLPKVKNKLELDALADNVNFLDMQIILLVEHPRLLLDLESIMNEKKYEKSIYGLALGSHDLVNEINANYSLEILNYPRQKLKFIASAYNKQAIDIASMNISNMIDFKNELKSGINFGYDAKFIIHPIQCEWLVESMLEMPEYVWSKKIIEKLPEGDVNSNQEPFIIDGQIIEKPHIQRALEIIKKYKDYGK